VKSTDILPLSKLIVAIVIFGFVFFFLNLGINAVIQIFDLTNGGVYIVAAIWLFTNLPAVALFGSALRYLMIQQKKSSRGGY
jgi:hypothetical protein